MAEEETLTHEPERARGLQKAAAVGAVFAAGLGGAAIDHKVNVSRDDESRSSSAPGVAQRPDETAKIDAYFSAEDDDQLDAAAAAVRKLAAAKQADRLPDGTRIVLTDSTLRAMVKAWAYMYRDAGKHVTGDMKGDDWEHYVIAPGELFSGGAIILDKDGSVSRLNLTGKQTDVAAESIYTDTSPYAESSSAADYLAWRKKGIAPRQLKVLNSMPLAKFKATCLANAMNHVTQDLMIDLVIGAQGDEMRKLGIEPKNMAGLVDKNSAEATSEDTQLTSTAHEGSFPTKQPLTFDPHQSFDPSTYAATRTAGLQAARKVESGELRRG